MNGAMLTRAMEVNYLLANSTCPFCTLACEGGTCWGL